MALLTQLTNQHLATLQAIQGETGIAPRRLIQSPRFIKIATNIFRIGRDANGKSGIGIRGNVNNILRDLAKVEKAQSIDDINKEINSSTIEDPFFGVDDVSNEDQVRLVKAYAKGMIDIINKDKLSFSRFMKTNKRVQKAIDYVKSPGKAFSDFRNVVDNPGNTDDILSKPFN